MKRLRLASSLHFPGSGVSSLYFHDETSIVEHASKTKTLPGASHEIGNFGSPVDRGNIGLS